MTSIKWGACDRPRRRRRSRPGVLFVYNADSGLFNTLADIGHKLFSPATYPCALCAITHGVFAERDVWRDFIASLGATCAFLHRDQFRERFPAIQETLPAIFRQHGDRLRLCADAKAIGACQGLDDLQALILRGCLEETAPDGDGMPENIQPIG